MALIAAAIIAMMKSSAKNQQSNTSSQSELLYDDEFVDYYPKVFDGDSFIVRDSILTRTEAINFVLVLGYYDISSQNKKFNKIKIPKWLNDDREYLLNLSAKSVDSSWLHDHIFTNKGYGLSGSKLERYEWGSVSERSR